MVSYIIEELSNLYLTVLIISFLFFCGLKQDKEPTWKNYVFELQNQGEHNATNIQTGPDYLSATVIILLIFWTERDFCIISDYRNSLNNKLKNW